MSHKTFSGSDYVAKRDEARLTGQMKRIFNVMKGGIWKTLGAIAFEIGFPESSISAQLRNLRKPQFGSHTIERRHVKNGLYQYRLNLKTLGVIECGQDI